MDNKLSDIVQKEVTRDEISLLEFERLNEAKLRTKVIWSRF